MKESPRTIALFGGTFDPVHTGHLILAGAVHEVLNLESVVFIPSARPPHKGPRLMFSAEKRYLMLCAATAGDPRFAVSDIELKREGPSYTVDTIRQFRESLPQEKALAFIIGMDNLYEMASWKDPRAIISECRLIVMRRPCVEECPVPEWLRESVEFVESPLVEISSSDIRARITEKRSIRHLVPDAVVHMIAESKT